MDNSRAPFPARVAPRALRGLAPVALLLATAVRAGAAGGLAAHAAQFSSPSCLAVDSSGAVYVSDFGHDTIRKVAPDGSVTTIAGSEGQEGSADGQGAKARFRGPIGIAVDRAGNLFVVDGNNMTIRKVTPDGVVTTIAGKAGVKGSSDGDQGHARFVWPFGIAVDADGTLYVSDAGGHTIRRIAPSGRVSTLAGKGGVSGNSDGAGAKARFNWPNGIALDHSGNLFVADSANGTIRKVSSSGAVTTVAGTANLYGAEDGAGGEARFSNEVRGLAVDGAGALYVGDTANHAIRRVSPEGRVSTLAGNPSVHGWADGAGSRAHFDQPRGTAVDPSGNVYVADMGTAWSAG